MNTNSVPLRSLESVRNSFEIEITRNINNVEDVVGILGYVAGTVLVLVNHTIRLKNRVEDLERKLDRMEKFG